MPKDYNASVAIVAFSEDPLSELIDRKIIFIKRSEHPLDPWSGHVAFPGGGVESIDNSSRDTSMRECYEEIGLSLVEGEFRQFISELTPKKAFKGSRLNLKSYLFFSNKYSKYFDASEVSDVFMVSVRDFFIESYYGKKQVNTSGGNQFGFQVKGRNYFIWGLTLAILLEYLSRQFPHEIKNLSFFEEYRSSKNKYLSIRTTEKFSN